MSRFLLCSILVLVASLAPLAGSQAAQAGVQASPAPERNAAYEMGYGYGFDLGRRDAGGQYRILASEIYRRGDIGYDPSVGSLENYQRVFRQGLEAGYADGYHVRAFDPRRGIPRVNVLGDVVPPQPQATEPRTGQTSPAGSAPSPVRIGPDRRGARGTQAQPSGDQTRLPATIHPSAPAKDGGIVLMGRSEMRGHAEAARSGELQGQVIRVRLDHDLDVRTARQGQRFSARIIDAAGGPGVVWGTVKGVNASHNQGGYSELRIQWDRVERPGRIEQRIEAITTAAALPSAPAPPEVTRSTGPAPPAPDSPAAGRAFVMKDVEGSGQAGESAVALQSSRTGTLFVRYRDPFTLPAGTTMTLRMSPSSLAAR